MEDNESPIHQGFWRSQTIYFSIFPRRLSPSHCHQCSCLSSKVGIQETQQFLLPCHLTWLRAGLHDTMVTLKMHCIPNIATTCERTPALDLKQTTTSKQTRGEKTKCRQHCIFVFHICPVGSMLSSLALLDTVTVTVKPFGCCLHTISKEQMYNTNTIQTYRYTTNISL